MLWKSAIIKIRVLRTTVALAPLVALLVSYLIAAGVEIAPPPLMFMLLCPVGEELALLVVLAQSLAVRGTDYSFYLL